MPKDQQYTLQTLKNAIAAKRLLNPSDSIDNLLSEEQIHNWDPETVLKAALDEGLHISKCLHPIHNGQEPYKANGIWVNPSEQLRTQLEKSDDYSYGYCKSCNAHMETERKELFHSLKNNQKPDYSKLVYMKHMIS